MSKLKLKKMQRFLQDEVRWDSLPAIPTAQPKQTGR